MPDYSLELKHSGYVAGIDEVGRGPLAGPVVASAVIFLSPPAATLAVMLDDSKKLTARKRQRAYEALMEEREVKFGVGAASVAEIDRLNISQACFLAMQRALAQLTGKLGRLPDLALVDGKHAPVLDCPVEMVIGGDGRSLSIAAASIIAKVLRDRLMGRLAHRHQPYGWERNAGYGTAVHLGGLRNHGFTRHHRRSFAPIRHMLSQPESAA
ncbi:ribonuclease HII [Oecophyllibacter saccharovorans]|uniref:Ribonuclease HII n=1 Tax=Oecophyllibacter saccharovorans TaxID=2558360 RepID=A0A506URE0_9PROT|nr:ribonuclease HII [Oecophyllibacter saccharovorans]TPW35917.1 ribonuclease HII [Oecophyllibacter saccharovorans]